MHDLNVSKWKSVWKSEQQQPDRLRAYSLCVVESKRVSEEWCREK